MVDIGDFVKNPGAIVSQDIRDEVESLFQEYRETLFHGKLSRWKVDFKQSVRWNGLCNYNEWVVK